MIFGGTMLEKSIRLFCLCLLISCQPSINTHGNKTILEHYHQFTIGKTTTNDVLQACGTPSLCRDEYTWIYVTHTSEEIAFKDVRTTDKMILKMTFDKNKVLKSIHKIESESNSEIMLQNTSGSLISEKEAEAQVISAININ